VDSSGEVERSFPDALLQDADEPGFVLVEEARDRTAHRLWQRVVVGGEHAAEAHSPAPQDVRVDAGIGVELGCRVAALSVDRIERTPEPDRVAVDQASPSSPLPLKW
jgi:hypothetical protein